MPYYAHVFPVQGPHGTRGAIGEFGAPRDGGRTHEGFDIVAACGTELVAVAQWPGAADRLRPGSLRQLPADPRRRRASAATSTPTCRVRPWSTGASGSGREGRRRRRDRQRDRRLPPPLRDPRPRRPGRSEPNCAAGTATAERPASPHRRCSKEIGLDVDVVGGLRSVAGGRGRGRPHWSGSRRCRGGWRGSRGARDLLELGQQRRAAPAAEGGGQVHALDLRHLGLEVADAAEPRRLAVTRASNSTPPGGVRSCGGPAAISASMSSPCRRPVRLADEGVEERQTPGHRVGRFEPHVHRRRRRFRAPARTRPTRSARRRCCRRGAGRRGCRGRWPTRGGRRRARGRRRRWPRSVRGRLRARARPR